MRRNVSIFLISVRELWSSSVSTNTAQSSPELQYRPASEGWPTSITSKMSIPLGGRTLDAV